MLALKRCLIEFFSLQILIVHSTLIKQCLNMYKKINVKIIIKQNQLYVFNIWYLLFIFRSNVKANK